MGASSVVIIDYGMGNLHSVSSALAHVSPDSQVQISADPKVILNADKVVFPGVGAIRDCMAEIRRLRFDTLVPEIVAQGKPLLGICVGMQALLESSEENGGVEGIGLLSGRVRFFGENLCDAKGQRLKVPHMGWNNVKQLIDHPLWHGIEDNSRFYFVHSYYAEAVSKAAAINSTDPAQYSPQVAGLSSHSLDFAAAVSHNNLFATQFHPEKSHTNGIKLLKNFVEWNGEL
ncbi:MAG: glutamine amidotransferase [Cellvibrionaceae bacterium]|jgi:glutamine amidotransferase